MECDFELTYDELKKTRGKSLNSLIRNPEQIPVDPGVYIWRYWPSIPDLSPRGIISSLREWNDSQPEFTEYAASSKLKVQVSRTTFGNHTDGRGIMNSSILGLSPSRTSDLVDIVTGNPIAAELVHSAVQVIIANIPPLYIGKASNLRRRLKEHFDAKTPVLGRIEKTGIDRGDIYISLIRDQQKIDGDSIYLILEEIFQNITNPPLVKRRG